MTRVKQVTIVLGQWCPHCVPLSLEYVKRMVKELNAPLRVLDIDEPKQEKVADELVEKYGDWTPDYIIPQIFLEFDDGRVQHIFTGFSEGVPVTRARWDDFLGSEWYRQLLQLEGEATEPVKPS